MFLHNLNLVSLHCNYYLIFYSIVHFLVISTYSQVILCFQLVCLRGLCATGRVSSRVLQRRDTAWNYCVGIEVQGSQSGTEGRRREIRFQSLALLVQDRSSGFPDWHCWEGTGAQGFQPGTSGKRQELRIPSMTLLGGDRAFEAYP